MSRPAGHTEVNIRETCTAHITEARTLTCRLQLFTWYTLSVTILTQGGFEFQLDVLEMNGLAQFARPGKQSCTLGNECLLTLATSGAGLPVRVLSVLLLENECLWTFPRPVHAYLCVFMGYWRHLLEEG